jgi:hypothetical protein
MKKLAALMIAASLVLTGCGQPANLTVNSKTKEYPTYGFFNQGTSKSSHVCYEVSVGNIVLSVLLFETVIAPIYFIGFDLFNPVSVDTGKGCGIDERN